MSKKEKNIRLLIYSFLYFLFLFVINIFFIIFKINLFNYEIILFTLGSLFLLILITVYFRKIENNYMLEGFWAGIIFFITVVFLNILWVVFVNFVLKNEIIIYHASEIKRLVIHLICLSLSIIYFTTIGYLLDYKSK